MAQYSHTTYLQFRQLLASRLGDANGVFFTDTELKRYTLEALRTWNAIANYYRTQDSFNTVNGTAFYDLAALFAAFVPNLKDQDLYTDIKYALMESATTANTWTGTDQFDQTVIQNAIEKRRNQFMLETSIYCVNSQVTVNPVPSNGRVSLVDSIIDIRRAAYKIGSTYYPLTRNDELDASSFLTSWRTTTGIPLTYGFYLPTKNSVQLMPYPNATGTLDLVTVNVGSNCDLSTGVQLLIPDDWAWAIKFGALADLLSREGQAQDLARAKYCEQRYQDAVLMASKFPSVHLAQIGSVSPQQPLTIFDLDHYSYSWQSTSGTPSYLAIAGRNLVALSPVPSGVTSVTIDFTANFPVPTADGDFIQIGRELIEPLLDYSIHLASFKMEGQEFEATYQNAQNFFRLAMQNNDRLQAEAKNLSIFKSYGKSLPEYQKPTRLPDTTSQAASNN